MDFVTAEEKFQELQARIRRGEPMSEDQYQEELAKLMVQDESGVFWSLEPGTGRWLNFNGTEWVPGTPPKQSQPPAAPVVSTTGIEQQPMGDTFTYQSPTDEPPPTTEETNYYIPTDSTHPVEYTNPYAQSQPYSSDVDMQGQGYTMPTSPLPTDDGMPTYVRMPEPDAMNTGGGIPPRPVRDASPLAVPGGERAWLPFAFGALVLLLCAVVLFFGVRGLPQFNGGGNAANNQPTDVPTEQVAIEPTATVELVPTDVPQPTEAPTDVPQPTAVPEPVKATTTDVLNIRAGPARTTASLGKLQKGTEVTVVGRNADSSWLQIVIPDKTDKGWVSADFVTITGDTSTLPVVGENGANTKPAATETPTG